MKKALCTGSILICLIVINGFSQSYKEDSLAVQAILDANGLSSIPVDSVSGTGLGNRIDSLGLDSLNITILPDQIGNLTALLYLKLSYNKLSSIPSTIQNCSKLQFIYLYNNELTSLPDEIGNLPELLNLFLDHNQLTELPAGIKNLAKIEKLKLSYNALTALPPEIGDLTTLRGLYCEENSIETIPAEIGNLTNMDILWLHRNNLSSIPKELAQCSDLLILNLANNKLTDLPGEITSLTLTNLDLSYNKLDTNKLAANIIAWADSLDPDWKKTQDVSAINFWIMDNPPFTVSVIHNTLQFNLPVPAYMQITMYNAKGSRLNTLIQGYTNLGRHCIPLYSDHYSSGANYLRIVVDKEYEVVRKIFPIK
jgi:Leucine-rich repeat (LRR) protein